MNEVVTERYALWAAEDVVNVTAKRVGDSNRFCRTVSINPHQHTVDRSPKHTRSDFVGRLSATGMARAAELALKPSGMVRMCSMSLWHARSSHMIV